MGLKARDIESALKSKGFQRSDNDHSFFVYYSQTGRKSPVRTKISHGSRNKDVTGWLLSEMQKQCHLSRDEFRDFVACPLSREKYEAILVEKELVDS